MLQEYNEYNLILNFSYFNYLSEPYCPDLCSIFVTKLERYLVSHVDIKQVKYESLGICD